MSAAAAFERAVARYGEGDLSGARAELAPHAREHPLYAHAVRWLAGARDSATRPYDRAEGFRAYRRTAGARRARDAAAKALRDCIAAERPATAVDLGCGDGEVLALALERVQPVPRTTLVEPSEEMLGVARERLGARASDARQETAQELMQADPRPEGWDLAVATWSLQNVASGERAALLAWMRSRARALFLIEYDVDPPAGAGRAAFYHQRYLAGVPELEELGPRERDAAAQAFLMPILFAASSGSAPANHEQPAEAWRAELQAAGFERVREVARWGHWWGEACSLLAT